MNGRSTAKIAAPPAPRLPQIPAVTPLPYPPAVLTLLVLFVRVGLCESWLVKAPECQSHGDGQSRSQLANLFLAMLGGIDQYSTERIKLFHRHREFFAQQVHQTRHTRGASRYHDALNVLSARRGTAKVKGLLEFKRQYVRYAAQYLLFLLIGNGGQRFALFESLRVFKAQVQFLLQGVGVLVAANAHVASKQRHSTANDVDVHHARANVQQRDRLPRIRLIIHFKAVLQTESIDIHHHRRFPGLCQHVGVIQNLVFLYRHQQHVHLRIHGLQQLIAEVHVRDVKRDMLARLRWSPVVQLFLGHQRQRYPLHNYRVARYGSTHILRLDFLRVENFADGVRYLRRVHDRTVHHRVLRQRFHPEAD